MSTVISISTERRYGVARVCRVWGVARAGIYRGRRTAMAPPAPRRRPGPVGAMSDADLVEAIRQVLADSPFHGEGYDMSRDFQKEIAWLGATSSPAFVRAPEGNGCAERFIRTLKENLLWVRTFRTVEELRLALIEFRRTYNESWLIERHGHRSPAQFRRDMMDTMPMAA